jgi:hypothetical protein
MTDLKVHGFVRITPIGKPFSTPRVLPSSLSPYPSAAIFVAAECLHIPARTISGSNAAYFDGVQTDNLTLTARVADIKLLDLEQLE